jgi:hypothetical protein
MKKPYQIEMQRAVKQFEAMAADGMRIPRDGDQRSELMSITIPK